MTAYGHSEALPWDTVSEFIACMDVYLDADDVTMDQKRQVATLQVATAFVANTGSTYAELSRLQWRDICNASKYYFKTEKRAAIQLPEHFTRQVERTFGSLELRNTSELLMAPLFENYANLSVEGFSCLLHEAFEKIGISGRHCLLTCLRQTFGKMLYENMNEFDEYLAKKLIGEQLGLAEHSVSDFLSLN
ncbi:MAG: hypothetical protein AAF843_20015 [Bacteroidota bacterium]